MLRVVIGLLAFLLAIPTHAAANSVAQGGVGVTFTASVSVPSDVAPTNPVSAGQISAVVIERDHVRFTVRNTGNVLFVAKAMHVVARGDLGTVISADSSAWSVLVNSQREFVLPIPAGACSVIKAVSITINAGTARLVRMLIPERDCR